MAVKANNDIGNNWEFGALRIKYWKRLALLLILIGVIIFCLQIRMLQCGNAKIVKEPLRTPKTLPDGETLPGGVSLPRGGE